VCSVSHHEAIVASCLAVLVADKTVATLSQRLALDVEKCAQVLKQTHLVAIVFSVVLDVALVRPQFFD
jgi:hypothetical protein